MSSIILDGTISVLSKALKNFAKEEKGKEVRPSEVKIIIALSDITVAEATERHPVKRIEGEPFYRIIKQNKPYLRPRKIKVHPGQAMTDEVSFLQVLDAKVDFFQVEPQSKPYLIDAFMRFTADINNDMLNNEGFKAYVKAEQDKLPKEGRTEEHYAEEIKKIEQDIIDENSVNPTDLEIWIITPELPIVQGKPADEPIQPIPFLYAKGELIRQIEFAKDIFQMVE